MRTAFVAIALATMGCSSDPPATVSSGFSGPMSIRFQQPSSSESPVCVSIGEDALIQVPLLIDVDQIDLQPPGVCSTEQCGHLVLFASDLRNNESAVPAIDLLVRRIADPYHDGSDRSDGTSDYLRLRVEALRSDGTPLLGEDEMPVTDTIDLITVPDCRSPF